VRNSLPHWALVLALTLAALPRAGSAGVRQVSLSPLFDTHQRFAKKKAVKLRFRLRDRSGAPIAKEDVSFVLKHGTTDPEVKLKARMVKAGVFEIPFAPQGPGLYAVVTKVIGAPVESIEPVKLSVIGPIDGMVEVPESQDAEFTRRAKSSTGSKGNR
jgi:hypothetical protein